MAESGIKASIRLLLSQCILSPVRFFSLLPTSHSLTLPLQCVVCLYQSPSSPLPTCLIWPPVQRLPKGADSGSGGCSMLCSRENPALLCGSFFLSSLPTALSCAMGLPSHDPGRRNVKGGSKPPTGGPAPGAVLPPCPSVSLAWLLPTCLLGELSSKAGASEKKKRCRVAGIKNHLHSLPPVQHVHNFSHPPTPGPGSQI